MNRDLGELLTKTQGRLTAVVEVEAASFRDRHHFFIVVSDPERSCRWVSLRYVDPVSGRSGMPGKEGLPSGLASPAR